MKIGTFAFLDNGSEITIVEDALVNELGVSGPRKPLHLKWTGDIGRTEKDSRVVRLYVSGKETTSIFPLKNVRTVKDLNLPKQLVELESDVDGSSRNCRRKAR